MPVKGKRVANSTKMPMLRMLGIIKPVDAAVINIPLEARSYAAAVKELYDKVAARENAPQLNGADVQLIAVVDEFTISIEVQQIVTGVRNG